jgi:hypothetical protein
VAPRTSSPISQQQSAGVEGIDGYLRVSTTVSTSTPHFRFINVSYDNGAIWMEQGEAQGCWLGGCLPDSVVMFTETEDAC